MSKPYKKAKRGTGRHIQLMEWFQKSDAWATLSPGPRALYIELKRRFNGTNNGEIFLSHRDAALAINVNRNTIGGYFRQLEERGLIRLRVKPHLGPSGIGQASVWSLEELPTSDGKPAGKAFMSWQNKNIPANNSGHAVPKNGTRKRE